MSHTAQIAKLTEENEKVWKALRQEQLNNQMLEAEIGQLKLTIERNEREREKERNEFISLNAGHLHTIEKLKVKSNLFG